MCGVVPSGANSKKVTTATPMAIVMISRLVKFYPFVNTEVCMWVKRSGYLIAAHEYHVYKQKHQSCATADKDK